MGFFGYSVSNRIDWCLILDYSWGLAAIENDAVRVLFGKNQPAETVGHKARWHACDLAVQSLLGGKCVGHGNRRELLGSEDGL